MNCGNTNATKLIWIDSKNKEMLRSTSNVSLLSCIQYRESKDDKWKISDSTLLVRPELEHRFAVYYSDDKPIFEGDIYFKVGPYDLDRLVATRDGWRWLSS